MKNTKWINKIFESVLIDNLSKTISVILGLIFTIELNFNMKTQIIVLLIFGLLSIFFIAYGLIRNKKHRDSHIKNLILYQNIKIAIESTKIRYFQELKPVIGVSNEDLEKLYFAQIYDKFKDEKIIRVKQLINLIINNEPYPNI